MIALGVVSAAAYYGHEWWTTGRFMVSTDDAYIGGDINYVAPKVGGYVKTVNVKANDYVKAAIRSSRSMMAIIASRLNRPARSSPPNSFR